MIKFKPQFNKKGKAITTFYRFDQSWYKPDADTEVLCLTCGLTTIKAAPGKWVGRCSTCNHMHNFIVPYPFQLMIQQTANKFINVLGGVGSAKTVGTATLVSILVRMIPGVKVFALAQTIDQLEQTSKEELEPFFFADEFTTKNKTTWVHNNGSSIHWIGSDSEQKLRGRNAGFIWLMEASSIPHEIHVQGTQRTRQDVMKEPALDEKGNFIYDWDELEKRFEMRFDRDRSQMILESNPHLGWIRSEALLKSHTIIASRSVKNVDALKRFAKPKLDEKTKKPIDMVTFMFASPDNPSMTSDYMSSIRANSKTKEDADRDIYCDMSFTKGMVFGDEIVNTKFINESDSGLHDYHVDGVKTFWIEGIDPGGAKKGNDHTGYILATYEMMKDGLPRVRPRYVFKESGLTLDKISDLIWEARSNFGWTRQKSKYFVCDPSGKRSNHYLATFAGDLAKLGIHVNTEVSNDINAGIRRMKTFIKYDRLILDANSVPDLVDEIRNYRWSDNSSKSRTIKKVLTLPYDKDNHLVDPLRYMIMKASLSAKYLEREKGKDTSAYRSRSTNIYSVEEPSEDRIKRSGNIFIK